MKDNIKLGLLISLVSFVFSYLFGTFAMKDFNMVGNLMFTIAFIIFTIAYMSYSKADKESFLETGEFLKERKNNRKIQDKKSALLTLAIGGIFNMIIYFILLAIQIFV